ncbi:growth-regulating factor 6-like [Argentina anserina]|uniref:growth-regulating factor 6-like n=1 Tax=Argentina anserina TaxID=57926 RepID=UPI00217666E8|nr:growth-regulating factor 6-like [Potentilla anserina]
MDFGAVGYDGFGGGSDIGFVTSSDQEGKNKRYGSGLQKQERSVAVDEEHWRSSKQTKASDDFSSAPKKMLQLNTGLMRTNSTSFDGQQLLSFSNSPKSEAQNASLDSLPSYFQQAVSTYHRNSGNNNSGSYNGATVQSVAGGRGPFTPSQWMELEHQALIYKYITANVPIPSNLLIPIKKALDSSGLFSPGLLRSNAFGWGSIHLGYANSTDPEPGRCRRTDGKKWRCWRDAVPDQKYCERHINRGRHRSRKPVEGQTGQSVAVTATTAPSKQLMPGGGGASSLTIANQQLKSLQPATAASNSSTPTQMSRMFMNKDGVSDRMQHSPDLSMLSKENIFLSQKQQLGFEESSFGLVTSDALLNPSQKRSSNSMMSCGNFDITSQNLTVQETESQHPLRHFIDDWPENPTESAAVVAWPDHLDMQSDRTQLSISIPKALASSDFIPLTSSTNNEKLTLSPLRVSRELDSVPVSLGVSSNMEQHKKQPNWIPITWEHSVGGPLGEVLHHTNINSAECKKSSVLNLMTEGCDNNSPSSLGSSPTGVLQSTAFGSVSSSAGSSPRAENRNTLEGASRCNELLVFPAL